MSYRSYKSNISDAVINRYDLFDLNDYFKARVAKLVDAPL